MITDSDALDSIANAFKSDGWADIELLEHIFKIVSSTGRDLSPWEDD